MIEEDISWIDSVIDFKNCLPAREIIADYLKKLYLQKNYVSSENDELCSFGPEDYKKYNQLVKIPFRNAEEKSFFDALMTARNNNKPTL